MLLSYMNKTNAGRRYLIYCIGALVLSLATESVRAYDWLQFGGDAQHSGNNAAEATLSPANVGSLVQKYQATLPATADGAPVFLEGVTTPSGVKDLLFVTTRDGRIIALDAQDGAQVWSHQYSAGTCQINNTGGACYTTSSPAIDPSGDWVYSYGLDGYVHKYQIGDGTEIIVGGWPELTTLKGFDEKGSSALAMATSNGVSYLYVVHGGYPGDNGDYQGHVTAINLATGAQKVFNAACSDQAVHLKHLADGVPPTCATPRNAIWSRPGVVYDAGTDRIFMGTGNGVFDGIHNWSESVIALHPDGTGGSGADAGKPLDSYTSTIFQSLDNGDTDLGSTAPAILPVPANSSVQHLAVQGGKDAKLRLINLANLSGQGGPGQVGGEIGAIINVPQGGVVLTQPAVWVNPADGSTWIFVVNGNGASGLRLVVDVNGNPSLATQWQNAQGGTSPVVANNMVFSLGGSTVRALDPLSGNVLWSLPSADRRRHHLHGRRDRQRADGQCRFHRRRQFDRRLRDGDAVRKWQYKDRGLQYQQPRGGRAQHRGDLQRRCGQYGLGERSSVAGDRQQDGEYDHTRELAQSVDRGRARHHYGERQRQRTDRHGRLHR